MRRDEGSLFGRGWHFPPGVGPDGRVAYSVGAENIRESIRIILSTEPRERVMLPEFGGGLKRFLFRPNITSTHRLMQETITRSLGRWEPRIQVQSVDVGPDPEEDKAARALIRYKVIATQRADAIEIRVQLS
jgi:phage baseplate assembly protein W